MVQVGEHMIGVDLLEQTGNSGITRPAVAIDFSGGGGGGLGGLASSVADAVGLGSGTGPSLADGLVSLRLVRGMAPDVDFAELLLAPVPGGPDMPAPGDSGTITVTAGDAESHFACTVDLVERRADGLCRVTATNGGRILARARVNLAFADQNPGAVIDALASETGTDSAAGSAGETLKSYVADDRQSVLDHVTLLATAAGRLAGFDDDGALTLFDDTATGEAVARFTMGENVIDHRIDTREASVGAVTVHGEGAADKGGNAWAWLRKDATPVSASAGQGQPSRRITAPWLRGQPASTTMADTRFRTMRRHAVSGRFLVQAAPQVVPGSLIEIAGTGAQDGTWLALRIELRFDLHGGMRSEIHAAPIGGGGGP